MPYTEPTGEKPSKSAGKNILETLRDRYELAADAWSPQAERERADLKFQIAEKEYQWDKDAVAEREGRPTLCVSQFDQPLQLILNQQRAAHLGINVHPLSETANNETAEIIQGVYRHIERRGQAHNARSWGFGRAVKAGRGSWRVDTEYNDKGSGIERFYQDITIRRMLYETVLWDPAAQEPDFSDAKYCFVESWLPHDEYAAEYGESRIASYNSDGEWDAFAEEAPGWTKVEKGTRSCRIVEYWRKEYVKKTIAILADGTEFEGDPIDLVGQEVLKNEAGAEMVRTYRECVVRRAVANGAEVLSDEEWNGRHIPIITMLGRELHPFDGERRMVGIIRNARGAQEVYNYAVSTLVERMALEPRAPWVLPEGGAEGHPEWNDAHRKMYPYLEYKPTALGDGTPAPPPFRTPIDSSGIAISVQALQQARLDFQSATSVFDPSLGRENKDRSGKAVLALQQQSDASTSDFMLNLQVAMAYEALVVLDLIPSIYDAPGRVTRILRGDDDKSEAVILNAPFMVENGKPVPVQVPPGMPTPPNVKTYNLKDGVYNVSISVGKSYQSRLDEGSTMLGEMFSKQPGLFGMYGDIFLKFQKWPGADEMAKRAVKVREMQFPGIGEGEDGQMPPEQMAAQVKAAQQKIEMMGMQMQQMQQALETDRAKQEAAILKAQMDNATKQQIATDENRTKLLVAEIAAGVKRELEHMNAAREAALSSRSEQSERRTLALKQAGETQAKREEMTHDTLSQAREHDHETQMQHREHAHAAGMAAGSGQSFEVQMDRGEEQGGEMSDERGESTRPQGGTE